MGYLISGHIIKAKAEFQKLNDLPDSLSWRIFQQPEVSAYLIETPPSNKVVQWPFTYMPSMKDIPLEFPHELEVLSKVYKQLEENRLANSFKRGLINLNLWISKLLETEVLSFSTDDDGIDFVCISEEGAFTRLHCLCDDIEVEYSKESVIIQPLSPEFEEDTEFLTDPTSFTKLDNSISVLDRNKPMLSELHAIASQEINNFIPYEVAPFGIGSFDPPEFEYLNIAEK